MRSAWVSLAALLGAACAAVTPEQSPPVATPAAVRTVAETWPGAAALLTGFATGGEQPLREGDAVLYGIELARGDEVTRHLLRVDVQRGKPANDVGTLSFRGFDGEGGTARLPDRVVRQVTLRFTLYDAVGTLLQESRSEPTPDFFFEASFVRGIEAARAGDARVHGIASARLLQIVRLLQQDPILKRLLGAVASVPFDLRLLFRRDIVLQTSFEKGRAVPAAPDDALATLAGPRYELPFDLLLNDAAFVRLMATVTDPHGPTGATAGILLLRAQQADDPTRQVRLQLLASARGPRTDWQAHGVLTSCGTVDTGVALAFSPDGRFVATPGERGVVELRDLAAADPTVPRLLGGAPEPVGALAFLDAGTLLVGRGSRVEVFAVGAGAWAEPMAPVRVVPTQRPVRALEVAGPHTCFVGLPAAEVERWTFGGEALEVETVRAPVATEAVVGDGPPMPFFELPKPGFLVAGDDPDRVVVGWRGVDHECVRGADGRWSSALLPPLPKGHTRADRWRRPGAALFDRLHHGAGWAQADAAGTKCFGGNLLMVMAGDRTRLVGRGHPDRDAVLHGFDPSGRCWVFVAPGYRVFVDCTRTP